jgi:hypothetical protein
MGVIMDSPLPCIERCFDPWPGDGSGTQRVGTERERSELFPPIRIEAWLATIRASRR